MFVPQPTDYNAFNTRMVAMEAAGAEFAAFKLTYRDLDFQIVTPSNGSTVTSNGKSVLILAHTALLLALTIAFPSNPRDGQRLFICSKSHGVTTLTLSNGTITGALSGLSALGWANWVYSSDASAWVRIG